jgi:hypothetical protein
VLISINAVFLLIKLVEKMLKELNTHSKGGVFDAIYIKLCTGKGKDL